MRLGRTCSRHGPRAVPEAREIVNWREGISMGRRFGAWDRSIGHVYCSAATARGPCLLHVARQKTFPAPSGSCYAGRADCSAQRTGVRPDQRRGPQPCMKN